MRRLISSASRCGRVNRRRGAAIVEMAVVTPLLLTLVFGIIEFSWAMSVQQSLTNAAREGCRTAIIKGMDDNDITARIDAYLGASGLSGYTVSITHGTTADPTERVEVTIPYCQISLVGGFFPGLEAKTLIGSCAMRQEGV